MRTLLVVLALTLAGCGGSPYPGVETSGDPDLDQTAHFVLWGVKQAREAGFDRPTTILQWMCSTAGSATLTPPSPEYEPDMAAVYRGPRPSENCAWRCGKRAHMPRYEIVVQANEADTHLIAAAFDNEGEGFGPVHVWEWAID